MEDHKISLTMIVKDEEDSVGKCLTSVADFVNEIIVVDTGSQDKTIDICESFGAKVLEFPWNGSFSDARNYGLKHARHPWILWLDADEEVDWQDAFKLQEGSYFKGYDILGVRLINYFGEQLKKDQFTQLSHSRLFRNNLGIHFVNAIHETLSVNDSTDFQLKQGSLDLRVYHYGYLNNAMQKKDKRNRNIKILEQQLAADNPWATFHLGAEYYQLGEQYRALEYMNAAIRQFLMNMMLPPPVVYKFKYAILTDLNCWDEAAAGIDKAVQLYPDYVDLHFYKGYVLFNQEKYAEAIPVFQKCIDLGDDNLAYYTVKGVGSFQAWYYQGQCYRQLSQLKEAIKCFVNSIACSVDYSPPKQALTDICQNYRAELDDQAGDI